MPWDSHAPNHAPRYKVPHEGVDRVEDADGDERTGKEWYARSSQRMPIATNDRYDDYERQGDEKHAVR